MAPPQVSAAASPAANSQLSQQFLSNVLSQRGPSSLPYAEDVKWLIRQHLLSLMESFPSLQAKTATFTHNDGRTVNLLQASGTLPMVYQNVTYNIPIVLWLMETYPRHPPCVFLNPTRDMIIKRPHPHVNPSGLVSIPYLHNWIYPSSNLLDLARHLTHIFGRDPPLYTRQTPTAPNRPLNPNPNPNPNPPIDHNPRPSRLSSASSLGSPYGAGAGAGAGAGYPPHQHHHHHRPSFSDDPNEVYRKNAINNILATVHADVAALRRNREAEMEGMFSAQAVLRQREEVLGKGFREMQEEKEGLEQQLQMVLMNSDVLEVWLRDNEGKPKMTTVDDVFEPCDVLSKQMLECTASDLAIEDLVYGLDKAVQEGSIPFDLYLKNIRSLSREQFFHRATAAKVRAAQMQAHVASMAARTSQYAL